jgi:hypothetical protein
MIAAAVSCMFGSCIFKEADKGGENDGKDYISEGTKGVADNKNAEEGAAENEKDFYITFYDFENIEGAVFTKVDIKNVSGKDFQNLLLTLSFTDINGIELFEYDAGVYLNYFNGQTMSLTLRRYDDALGAGYYTDGLADIKVKQKAFVSVNQG